MAVLRGAANVHGPAGREVVVRRVPRHLLVEKVLEEVEGTDQPVDTLARSVLAMSACRSAAEG